MTALQAEKPEVLAEHGLLLKGKKIAVFGVANKWSIAWAITILMMIGFGVLLVFWPNVVAPLVFLCLACVGPFIAVHTPAELER